MNPHENRLAVEAAKPLRVVRATGAIALASLLALALCASAASAEPLSMTFTEARANVGVQLSDAALFAAPGTAPLEAQIDPGSGQVTAGDLQVPEFSTHITEPINADVSVDFDIGTITGSFTQASGALTLEGEAGGILTSEGRECTVSTDPSPLILSTAGNSGGTNSRSGVPFTDGLTGAGAIAGQWNDMHAAPISGDTSFCNNVEGRIGGSGGIWLVQEGDVVPPSAPQLISADPASPGLSGTPRILGAAESNVAPCQKAIIGHGSADWRSESLVAGPVGVRRHPLWDMSQTRNGFVTKMPLLVEGREPQTVTVSVPMELRDRVFLYYGRVLDRDGKPTFSFANARGYGETEFQLCGNKPRTIWPGGIRIKGTAPVHLLVSMVGASDPIPLPLGRPHPRPSP